MAEHNNQQFSEGGDNPAQAAQQIAKAAKQATAAASKAASVGSGAASGASSAASGAAASAAAANATANASAAAVNASVQAGQAAANVAVGTATGGPWGAILAAAWSMRHTLFKILICICLGLTFIITMIVSLPAIMFEYMKETGDTAGIYEAFEALSENVDFYAELGFEIAVEKAIEMIKGGDYDYDMSMSVLKDNGSKPTDRDICYILSAYSVSMEQKDATPAVFKTKLSAATDSMFTVTGEEKEEEHIKPLTYTVYKSVSLVVVTGKTQTGTINGVPQYRYTTATRTYYTPDKEETTTEPVTQTAYRQVTVELPVYTGTEITGTTTANYYEPNGTETLTPETEIIKYLECTISPLNKNAILASFGIDPAAQYGSYPITNAQAIDSMSYALMSTLFGRSSAGYYDVTADEDEITQIGKFPVPVTGSFTVTSGYGERIHPVKKIKSFHYGIDIAGAHHCKIISIADGTVVFAGMSDDTHIVKIRHTDENGKVFYSRYLHLADIYVTEGQTVTAKQVIGTEGGAEGELGAGVSTGPHLHFELRNENDIPYDPYDALFKPLS